ncbi:phage filamentation protein Fil family protein [Citrobacter farmeri]
MKAFVTYLKKESPAMQLPSGSTGWIELPNGQRWNPGHMYKFNGQQQRRPWWRRLLGL